MKTEPLHRESVIEIGHTDMKQGYKKLPHSTHETFFLFCECGHGIVTINFEKHIVRPGCFISVYSDDYFSIDRLQDHAIIQIIRLDEKLFDEVTIRQCADFWNFWMENRILYLSVEQVQQMQAWFLNANWIVSCREERNMREFMLRNQLESLFTAVESCCIDYMQDHNSRNDSNAHRILQRFWRLLVDNCKREHEVRFYAEQLNITTHYLAKITRKAMGYSPKECIDWQRINEIKQELHNSHKSIKEIADNFGFESSSYLISYFRRHTGITPNRFRKNNPS